MPDRTTLTSLLGLALATACSTQAAPSTWLDTERARVTARLVADGERWRVRDIEAVALGEADLLALRMSVFVDANGNGQPDDGEQRGSWALDSATPSRELGLKGSLSWSELDPGPGGPWLVETRVTHEQGEDHAVRPAFDATP